MLIIALSMVICTDGRLVIAAAALLIDITAAVLARGRRPRGSPRYIRWLFLNVIMFADVGISSVVVAVDDDM